MNKKTITIIVGLPGSGKSALIQQRFSKKKVVIYDDFQANAIFDKPDFTLSKNYPDLVESIRSGKSIVLSDISYCKSSQYKQAKATILEWISRSKYDYELKTIFFENNSKKCKRNLSTDNTRNKEERLRKVEALTEEYDSLRLAQEEKGEILPIKSFLEDLMEEFSIVKQEVVNLVDAKSKFQDWVKRYNSKTIQASDFFYVKKLYVSYVQY